MVGATRLPPVSSQLYRSVASLQQVAVEALPDADQSSTVPEPKAKRSEPCQASVDLRALCHQLYARDADGLVICKPSAGSQNSIAAEQRG